MDERAADDEIDRRLRQSFDQMRANLLRRGAEPAAPEVVPEEVVEPSVPAKLFIGPGATFYDDRWRWMDWSGRTRSWSWPAALTFGAWFGYRRMYGWMALYLVWVFVAPALGLLGVPWPILLSAQAGVMLAAGLYGNFLYLLRYRRVARRVVERYGSHEAQVQALAAAGGVDGRSAYLVCAAVTVMAAVTALALD
jgi:hypothetical protein